MTDIRLCAVAALLAGLAACAPGADAPEGEPTVAPEIAEGADACGASGFQTLVGTSVGTLDPSTLPEPRRIIFPGQAVTMDFSGARFNVEIGSNDQVLRVFCG